MPLDLLGFNVTLWFLSSVPKADLCQCFLKPELGSFNYLHSFICIYSLAFIFINSIRHWVNKYLLRTCSVPGTPLGAGDSRLLGPDRRSLPPTESAVCGEKGGPEAIKEGAEAQETKRKGSRVPGSLTGLIQWRGKDYRRIAVDLWRKGGAWGSGQIVENSFRIRAMREDREVRR